MPSAPRLALSLSFGVVSALAAGEAAAKAAYVGLAEAVAQADTIAIVHTEVVDPTSIEGEHWHYRQLVHARVLATLKGAPGERIEIAANKDFICAPVPYRAGADYLVFLANDGGHQATVNNEMGQIEIGTGFVDWPYDDSSAVRALPDVLLELQTMLGSLEPIAPPPVVPAIVEAPREPSPTSEAESELASWSAPVWIASGAFAVVAGMLVATRRRRRR